MNQITISVKVDNLEWVEEVTAEQKLYERLLQVSDRNEDPSVELLKLASIGLRNTRE
jgi:hypothetical protein